VQEIFEENESKILYGAIIWTPMLLTDNLGAAEEREIKFSDPRVKHFWDPNRILGQLLSQTLKLKTSTAWDVYLVYPPSHYWNVELPPMPEFWMHQLDEAPAFFFNPPHLKSSVRTIIDGVKHE
jgi:hypothetical protein